MKKKLVAGAVTLLSVLTLAACTNGTNKDVVTMKGDTITVSDFYDEIKTNQGAQQVLFQMTINKVFEKEYGSKVSDKEVDKELAKQKKQLGNQFDAYLAQQGLTEETAKKQIRSNMLLEYAVNQAAKKDIKESDYKAAFESYTPEVTAQIIKLDSEDKAKEVLEAAKAEGAEQVILTDHNEFQQSVSDIAEVEVYGVVDHHRVANFETANPLMMRLEPVGSASSIVYRMFKENNVEVPKEVAGLLLSGLISDTLLLKSPTTHASDPAVAAELAEIAGVNLEEYGLAMLKAGTNLSSKSAEELIDIDAKTFELNGNQVRVAQVNTVDISDVLSRQEEIEEAINNSIKSNGYSDFVLMITDILNSNSEILALGSNTDKVEAAFNFVLDNNHAFLEGAVSRKKQVVPQLTESFNA